MTTTATDQPGGGVLVRVLPQETGAYVVADLTGLRYGHDYNLKRAVKMWAQDVSELLTEDLSKLGGPILAEALAYQKALTFAPLPPQ